jgi:hypothetical protein
MLALTVVTGKEYVIDRMYVLHWNMIVSILLKFEAANLVSYWLALLLSGVGQNPWVHQV